LAANVGRFGQEPKRDSSRVMFEGARRSARVICRAELLLASIIMTVARASAVICS
jgi:hypothetical protein